MISVFGTSALAAAVLFGLGAALAWSMTARTTTPRDIPAPVGTTVTTVTTDGATAAPVARWCTAGAWLAAISALVLMEWALLTGDFSVSFVAETGSRDLPVYYAVTSLWAGAGGSLILWLSVLATFVAVAARKATAAGRSAHAVAMTVLTVLLAVFAVLTLFGADPFRAVDAAGDGPGPNPLLQDHPAMGIHPPLLYAGFAGLSVPFALALGALAAGRVDGRWARAVRPWTLAAWIFLAAGVALGAWWSYAVLGWGGYWAWDPVENVSLMPWLLTTALLHVLRMPRRTKGWAAGAVTLAGAAFLLVVLGTLLTRSGALLSVHSFSDSPLGLPLLGLFAVVLVAWVTLLVTRRGRLGAAPDAPAALLSRQTALRGQVALLALMTATIFAGTILPVLVEIVSGDRLSVGAPWFNRTTGPVALALLALMAIGPLLAWDRDTAPDLLRRLRAPAVVALLTIGVAGLAGVGGVVLTVAVGLAAFVVVTLLRQLGAHAGRRRVGAFVAHTGIAVAAVAVVASGYGSSEQSSVAVGEAVTSGRYSATLLSIDRAADDRRASASARVLIGDGDRAVGVVEPELRLYSGQSNVIPSPANMTGIGRDVQVALLDVDPDNATATIRVTVTPMLVWLWIGAALTALGGVVAAVPRRRRSPSPPATASPPVMAVDDDRPRVQEMS